MTFNNEATDGSEQEIVLDPESLTLGHDLRPARLHLQLHRGRTGEVNLSFSAMGSRRWKPVWFNQDDATTLIWRIQRSESGLLHRLSLYLGMEIRLPASRSRNAMARAPFCLYALTNRVVPGEELRTRAAGAEAPGEELGTTAAGADAEAAPAASGGLTAGFTAASADEVGVASDTFYSDETLNSNGEWVDVGG